jgi:hypothetical protein
MSVRAAAAVLALTLAVAGPARGAGEIWLFTTGLLCNDPKDVAEIVDAPVVRVRIAQKVLSGECLSNSTLPPRRISAPETRTSPGGKRYVCFREAASETDERFHPDPYCARESSVITLAAEIARRTGDYEVLQHDTTGPTEIAKVRCLEGGTLTLVRPPGKARYIRLPFVFMAVARTQAAFAEADDLDTAMRDGCKGADYRR